MSAEWFDGPAEWLDAPDEWFDWPAEWFDGPAEWFDVSSSWRLLYVTPSTTEPNSKEQQQSNQTLIISIFSLKY